MMTSEPREVREKATFSSRNPHFFKIILEDTLKEKKLRVPKYFVKKCGETLSDSVFVKLPCGSEWKMKLTEYDGKFWLENGWPEFVEHYSIRRGNLLTFRYEGNSELHVVVFDINTVEIDYPSGPVHFDESNTAEKFRAPKREVIDADSAEILDDFLPCPKTGFESSSPCSPPLKRMKIFPTSKTQSNISHTGGKLDPPAKSDRDTSSTVNALDNSEKRAALQRTGGFESDRPSFEVVMQPYYVRGKRLAFPSNFAKKHLKKRNEDVILKLPNGKKTWLVKYFFGEHKKAAPLFRGGWKAFARDNDLKVGDVCVFVLLEGEVKVSFEVLIFRDRGISNAPMSPAHDETSTPSDRENLHSDQANGCKSTSLKTSQETETQVIRNQLPLTFDEKVRILEKALFESEKRSFKAVIRQSYKWNVHVPLDLAMRHIKNEGGVVLSIPNGRSWYAQLRIRKSAALICCGWKEFVADNNLEVGDVCIFELINATKISFQVSIIRVSDGLNRQESQAGDFAKGAYKPNGVKTVKTEID